MHEKQKEVQDLKRLLLTTRLTALDRKAIEAGIEELSPTRRSEDRPRPPSPYVLGVFDRPKPSTQPGSTSSPQPQPQPVQPGIPSQPRTSDEPQVNQPVAPSLPPEEIERRCKLLAEICGRINLLRSTWATTLSREILCQVEAWIAKLQEIAASVPRDMAEQAVSPHVGFLTHSVQRIAPPQIPEAVQKRCLPPSAPGIDPGNLNSDLYWYLRSPSRPREPERPVGYVPDGLQSWVS